MIKRSTTLVFKVNFNYFLKTISTVTDTYYSITVVDIKFTTFL